MNLSHLTARARQFVAAFTTTTAALFFASGRGVRSFIGQRGQAEGSGLSLLYLLKTTSFPPAALSANTIMKDLTPLSHALSHDDPVVACDPVVA